ncbi:MAG: hypothetical protein LUH05_03660 [Candidatus Gastranaerophilales bacterium]|nr:hypothetical protein [Candidatus Gastranaerophilales bacterium]
MGEIKKGKYIYYHCADKTKNCINKKIYLKEETINKVFDNAIKQIQITPEHRQAIIEALKDCHSEQQTYNTEEINRLNKRAEALRNRLSKIYLDKLDGNITEEFWQDKNNEWTLEHAGIMQKLDAYERANVNYMKQASELLELLENLYTQYIQFSDAEKTKVLKIIFSNFLIEGENIRYDYKKPFDIFAKGLSCTINWAR